MRVESWLDSALAHDPQLHHHSGLVALLTGEFASFLGYSLRDREQVIEAAIMHDVGKLRIPRELLQKPSALNADERMVIHNHPSLGGAMLRESSEWSEVTLDAVEQHHERLDGSGYPLGLLARDIGEAVRIVTICDVYAAVTETRSYGVPMSWDAASAFLARMHSRLDMPLVQHFSRMLQMKCRRRPLHRNAFY